MTKVIVKVAIADGNTVTDVKELTTSGQPVRIKAVANGKYILAEGEKGFAPQNITAKRVGKDLHVTLEGGDPDQPQLIIEGFYDSQGQLVGMAEDGSFHEYVAADAVQDHSSAFLIEGVPAPQVLGAESVLSMSGMSGVGGLAGGVFGTGIGLLGAGLIGLAGLGLVGAAVAAGNDDDDKKNDSAPTPSAPIVSVTGDNVGSDTGPLVNGGSTDDTTPTFSGEGTPGNTIIIKDGEKVIGETIIGEDGKWTFTPEPLGAGPHDIVFVERNRDGIEGPPSPGFEIIVDVKAPAQTVINSVHDDVGIPEPIVQNGKTNDSTPTLNGQAEPGSKVEIFANGEKIGEAPVGADGTWSFTPSPLQNDTYSLTVVAVDAAGNRGLPSDPFVVTIYTVLPGTPGQDGNAGIGQVINDDGDDIPAGSSTNDSTPTFTGSGQEPGSTVTLRDKNGAVIGEANVDADGNWSVTPATPLTDENHEIVMIITDPIGNESLPSDPFVIVVDTTAPGTPGQDGNGGIDTVRNDLNPANIDISNGGSTNDTTPTIVGSNQKPGDKVTIYNGTEVIGTAIVGGDGTWSITPVTALTVNTYSFTMTVTDQSDNESAQSAPYVVTIDTTAPGIPGQDGNAGIGQVVNDAGEEIPADSSTNDTTPTFSGSGQIPGEKVKIYDGADVIGEAVVDDSGNWTITPDVPLSEADHDITMTVTDPAGNESLPSDPFVIIVDTTAPAAQATIVSMDKDSGTAGDFVTNDGTAGRTVSGTLTAALAADEKVQVSLDGGVTWEDAIDDGAAGWTFVDNSTHVTGWEIQARVIDSAGNPSAIATQQVTLDTTVAAATFISWDGSTIHVEFAPAGMAVGNIVQITVDGVLTEHALTAAELSTGIVEVPFAGALNDAPEDIRIALMDSAGNVSNEQVLSKDVSLAFTENFNGKSDVAFVTGQIYTLTDFSITAVEVGLGAWNTGFGRQGGSGDRPDTTALELGTSGATLKVDITNPASVNTLNMTVGDLSSAEQLTAVFYDASGKEVYRQVLTAAGGLTVQIVVELPYGVEFSSFDLVLANGSSDTTYVWIDDIEFGHYDYVASEETSFAAVDQTITTADTYQLTSDDNVFSIADVALLNDSSIEVVGDDGLNTLMLTGAGQVLDLTNIAGKLESIEIIDITGTGNNTLTLSLGDVLEQGQTSLFTGDDTVQMMVKGNTGDVINLDDQLSGTDPGDWTSSGTATVGGVTYDVFSHSTVDAELLVQQGVTTNLV